MKSVQCVQTGIIYESVSAAAASVGVSVGMINHVLRGRKKHAKGYTFIYKPGFYVRRYKIKNARIRDDAGNWYEGYKRLAAAKGLTVATAYRLTKADPEGIFRNAHLYGRTPRPPSKELVTRCERYTRATGVLHYPMFGWHGWFMMKDKGDLFGEIDKTG